MTEQWWCIQVTYRGSLRDNEPPEYCDNPVADGEDYCPVHLEEHWAELERIVGIRGR